MRILLINKFYYPSGGAERYVFEWERVLRARGHNVSVFAMAHPDNRPSDQADRFVSRVNFEAAGGIRGRVNAAIRSVYSHEAAGKLKSLISDVRPELVHVHSYCFQLTPAIFVPLTEAGIPVVQTAHEYYHACANQRLYDSRSESICESCRVSRLAPLWRRCLKRSLPASATAFAAKALDDFLRLSRTGIDRIVAPSAFMRRQVIAGGWSPQRVVHVPNFVDVTAWEPAREVGDHLLFVGRLVQHKGVMTLLKASEALPDVPLKVAGEGPLESDLRQMADARHLRNLEFLGFLQGEALRHAIAESRAVVVPSEWYENASLVVLEAMAAARAVVASDIGGTGEQVRDGQEGLLFPAGNQRTLVERLKYVWDNPREASAMGERGRRRVENHFSVDEHYRRMMQMFRDLRG